MQRRFPQSQHRPTILPTYGYIIVMKSLSATVFLLGALPLGHAAAIDHHVPKGGFADTCSVSKRQPKAMLLLLTARPGRSSLHVIMLC